MQGYLIFGEYSSSRAASLIEPCFSILLVRPEEELHGVVLDVCRGHHLAGDCLVASQLAFPPLQPVHQRKQHGQGLLHNTDRLTAYWQFLRFHRILQNKSLIRVGNQSFMCKAESPDVSSSDSRASSSSDQIRAYYLYYKYFYAQY